MITIMTVLNNNKNISDNDDDNYDNNDKHE